MRTLARIAIAMLISGLLVAWSATAQAQEKDLPPRNDPPPKETRRPERDTGPKRGPRADRPRTERDREAPPREGEADRPGPRRRAEGHPQAEAAIAPPLDAGGRPGMLPGRRFPMRGPGGPPRGPAGLGELPGQAPLGAGPPWQRYQGPDQAMLQLDREDQELGRLSMQLAAALRHAAPEERDALRKKLRETVDKHFDVRQKRRELQLKQLEQQLQQLREAIEHRTKVRDQIIERRMAELTGEEDPLDF